MGCPDDKRGWFMKQFDKLRRTNFEGEPPVSVVFNAYQSPIIMHRPKRKVLRAMAWAFARRAAKEAAAQRATTKKQPPTPKGEQQIVIPDMSKALARPGEKLGRLG